MKTETVKNSAVKSKVAVVPVKKITTAAAKSPAVKASATKRNGKSTPPVPRIAAAKAKPSVAVKKVPANKVVAKPVAMTVAPKEKIKKAKLVRDSFTMPEGEYAIFGQIKKACANAGMEVKKSQLLRVGLALINKTDVSDLKTLIIGLAPLKVGRPMKDK